MGPMKYMLAITLSVLCLHMAAAHDGPHSPDMMAAVISATQTGSRVSVSLVLTGLGGPLVLTGMSAPGARKVTMAPVYVNFAEDIPVTAVLEFSGPVPRFFTLDLDFGPVGRGSVSVVVE